MSLNSRYFSAACHSGPSVNRKPVAIFSNATESPTTALNLRIADLDIRPLRADVVHFFAACFFSSLTRVEPTYQSSAATSSNTTQIASGGSCGDLADRRGDAARDLVLSLLRMAFEDLDVHERHGLPPSC